MSRHAIIVIKNDNNEYLQYYDERWNSYLFLNCKLEDNFNDDTIKKYVADKLNIDINNITCKYISDKIHTKFSESAQKEKEYHHYFYKVIIDIPFSIDDNYKFFSYEKLMNDERIKKVNSDIIGFINELNL